MYLVPGCKCNGKKKDRIMVRIIDSKSGSARNKNSQLFNMCKAFDKIKSSYRSSFMHAQQVLSYHLIWVPWTEHVICIMPILLRVLASSARCFSSCPDPKVQYVTWMPRSSGVLRSWSRTPVLPVPALALQRNLPISLILSTVCPVSS